MGGTATASIDCMLATWIVFERHTAWLLAILAASVAAWMIATGMLDELIEIFGGRPIDRVHSPFRHRERHRHKH